MENKSKTLGYNLLNFFLQILINNFLSASQYFVSSKPERYFFTTTSTSTSQENINERLKLLQRTERERDRNRKRREKIGEFYEFPSKEEKRN